MTTKAEDLYNLRVAETNAEFKQNGWSSGYVDAVYNETVAAKYYIQELQADVLAHKQELNRRKNGYFALKLKKVEDHCIYARDLRMNLDGEKDRLWHEGYIDAAKRILELIDEEDVWTGSGRP